MATTPTNSIGAELRARLADRIARDELELPLLPQSAQELLRASEDPDADARSVADILHRDAAVAGHLLRLANSPLYAPSVPIVSLQQAVSRLGFARIREIALTIACSQRVFRVPGHEGYVRAVFRHSLATGVVAQELARTKRWNVEQAFLTGLLHDVGKPVALQMLADDQAKVGSEVSASELQELAEEFHEPVAERLTRAWKFPDVVSTVIAHHHSPLESEGGCHDLATVLGFADDIAQHLFGPREIEEEQIRQHPLAQELNLYPDEVNAMLALRERISAALEDLG